MVESFSERNSAKLAWFRLSLRARARLPSRPDAPARPEAARRGAPRRSAARGSPRRAARRGDGCRERCLPDAQLGSANPAALSWLAIPAVIEAKRSAARASALLWVAADSHLRELFSFRSKTLRSAWNWSRKAGPHGLAQSAIPYSTVLPPGERLGAGRRLAEVVALKAGHHLDQAQVLVAPAHAHSAPQLRRPAPRGALRGAGRLASWQPRQWPRPRGPRAGPLVSPSFACCESVSLLSRATGSTIRVRTSSVHLAGPATAFKSRLQSV